MSFVEEPPVLFQIRCYQNSLEVGGCPWHFIYTPPNKRGSFQVKSLSSEQLVSLMTEVSLQTRISQAQPLNVVTARTNI